MKSIFPKILKDSTRNNNIRTFSLWKVHEFSIRFAVNMGKTQTTFAALLRQIFAMRDSRGVACEKKKWWAFSCRAYVHIFAFKSLGKYIIFCIILSAINDICIIFAAVHFMEMENIAKNYNAKNVLLFCCCSQLNSAKCSNIFFQIFSMQWIQLKHGNIIIKFSGWKFLNPRSLNFDTSRVGRVSRNISWSIKAENMFWSRFRVWSVEKCYLKNGINLHSINIK